MREETSSGSKILREERLVITFPNMTAASAFAAACQDYEIPGRLIPKPREISPSCGTAYCCALEFRQKCEIMIAAEGLETEGLYTISFRIFK